MIKDLLTSARSVRSFDRSIKVTENDLLKMIDNARISSATMNLQPLKYRMVTDDGEVMKLVSISRFATSLQTKLPPLGQEPSAFIVVCHDESITPFNPIFLKDVGICSETIMLTAAEMGLGCCMIGSADNTKLCEILGLSDNLLPELIIAIGKSAEKAVLEESAEGQVKYYRDSENVHHVPKRTLSEIVIK